MTEDHTFTAEWKADEEPTPTPTPIPKPAPKPIPTTGDENPQVLALAVIGAALVGAYALRYARSASRFSKQS